jgi:Nucleotide modification associated domain 3
MSRNKRSALAGKNGMENGLLVRVGADRSTGGGSWNGPVDTQLGTFAYVPIPETHPVHAGLDKPYSALAPVLSSFGSSLPAHLCAKQMHLDPDFARLTYGDQGGRARQLRACLSAGDLLVFYASLFDVTGRDRLVYAIIGVFVVETILPAADVPVDSRDINAHSRRILPAGAEDLIVCGRAGLSGRLEHCLPIGEWRDRAYRVRRDIVEAWGGLSIKDGYVQRSARLPQLSDPRRFQRWLTSKKPILIQANN